MRGAIIEGGVVTRVSDFDVLPEGWVEVPATVSAGFRFSADTFSDPMPEPIPIDTSSVTIPRTNFEIALVRKGIADGLNDAAVSNAIALIPDAGARKEAEIRCRSGQFFSHDEPLILLLAGPSFLNINFTRSDFVAALNENFDAIS